MLSHFKPGNFSFIEDPRDREMYSYDYKVITCVPGAWDFIRNYPKELPLVYNDDLAFVIARSWAKHTTHTFRLSMCIMRFIARHSWEEYVLLHI